MSEQTKIEWCDHTFNPWIGCTKVAPGCQNCYAETFMGKRMHKVRWGPNGTRKRTSDDNWRQPLKWNAKAEAEGVRRRVFCASHADVFEDWRGMIVDHNGHQLYKSNETGKPCICGTNTGSPPLIMDDLRCDLFELIDATPHLDWLLVTKRPENIRAIWPREVSALQHFAALFAGRSDDDVKFHDRNFHRKNVWLLTSISDQETADRNIPELLKCRDLAPVLGISAEPLLGPVEFSNVTHRRDCVAQLGKPALDGIDWVIVGGESGSGARPCRVEWIESILQQCRAAGVPAFCKQFGAEPRFPSLADASAYELINRDPKGGDPSFWPKVFRVREFPKPESPNP